MNTIANLHASSIVTDLHQFEQDWTPPPYHRVRRQNCIRNHRESFAAVRSVLLAAVVSHGRNSHGKP